MRHDRRATPSRGVLRVTAPTCATAIDPATRAAMRAPAAKGQGLNSIPIRFALLAAACSGMCVLALIHLVLPLRETLATAEFSAVLLLTIAVPALVTFAAASKLTAAIRALRLSTDAIVQGDFNRPVDVDCACEVGGLADSFRAMIERLNSNILRMNVLAYTDPVTRLPNRAVISHVLGLVKTFQPEGGCKGALLFIDLDGFKRINDTLGHEAGDELLRRVAERIIGEGFGLAREEMDDCTTSFGELRQTCPDRMVFARFAGDEFVVLLPGEADVAVLDARSRRIIAALEAPFRIRGNEVHVGASIGVARLPFDTEDAEQLLSFADIAMYAAKEAGRNRVRFFDASLKAQVVDRNHIEAELRHAILRDELSLHFQPKLDCRTLAVEGVEALLRWNHPVDGAIAPARFIPVAEQSGQMAVLGTVILRLAVRQMRAWQDQGRPMRVAVNVSAVQLEQPGLVQEVLGILAAHGVAPHWLELEITESMLMSTRAATLERIETLRAAGVRISVDDFGTGYSNLSQLARLPSDVLKIDRSLLDGVGTNPKVEAILQATVRMAHSLGHRVVAEGIETPVQHAFLTRIGCDLVQGFLFARPMPAAGFDAWLAAREAAACAA
jgi:diguanylate cyclase